MLTPTPIVFVILFLRTQSSNQEEMMSTQMRPTGKIILSATKMSQIYLPLNRSILQPGLQRKWRRTMALVAVLMGGVADYARDKSLTVFDVLSIPVAYPISESNISNV
jgi:hypothetical protein